ncbi:1,4-dihydroxy-2-naphthoyl-CoA synthase [Streptomyces alboniger]
MTDLIRYSCEEGVARIVLARPTRANAVDLPTAHALGAAVDRAAQPDVRAVVVLGEGRRFCAGGDVAAMAAARDRAAYVEELATTLDDVFRRLAGLSKPVVAAVRGAVAGAGLALMLSCDVIVSAASTKFLLAYADVGLTPDCGVSYLLPRAIGQQRALDLALTGRVLTAEESRQWGLVTEVVDDASVDARAVRLGERLATGPTHAFGETKTTPALRADDPRADRPGGSPRDRRCNGPGRGHGTRRLLRVPGRREREATFGDRPPGRPVRTGGAGRATTRRGVASRCPARGARQVCPGGQSWVSPRARHEHSPYHFREDVQCLATTTGNPFRAAFLFSARQVASAGHWPNSCTVRHRGSGSDW